MGNEGQDNEGNKGNKGSKPTHILLLNPNSSTTMTNAMEETARRLDPSGSVILHAYTAPSGPLSINDDAGIQASTQAVLNDEHLMQKLKSPEPSIDAIIIACFSVHPLVAALGEMLSIPVVGIFEASVALVERKRSWGIVTTGAFWEAHLTNGVERLGLKDEHFAGVFCSGLTAADFHGASSSADMIEAKLGEATRKLLQSSRDGDVVLDSVVMGCGGMSGLSEVISSTAAQVYGTSTSSILVVDPVMAGLARALELVR